MTIALSAALALTTAGCASGGDTANGGVDRSTIAAPAQSTSLNCDGVGIDPAARIRYSSEVFIHAPLHTVWNVHTDVERWPSWQDAVASIKRLNSGPLEPGSQFRWKTPVPATAQTPATTLVITSTVQDVHAQSCIRWSGPAIGDGLRIDNGVHVWNFAEVDGGVLVSTEESWTGTQVEADVATSTAHLGAGLDAWLNNLKVTAENIS